MLFWRKHGYHLDEADANFKRNKKEDYPWQCPYQLGECTGEYIGWIDEYLAKIDQLLSMTVTIFGGKFNPSVQLNYTNMRSEFVDLRAWYWYYSSIMKEDSSALVDLLFSRLAFFVINKRRRNGNFPFAVLDDHFKEGDSSSPPLWESLIEFVSRFYHRLRMAKYSIINLGEILPPTPTYHSITNTQNI